MPNLRHNSVSEHRLQPKILSGLLCLYEVQATSECRDIRGRVPYWPLVLIETRIHNSGMRAFQDSRDVDVECVAGFSIVHCQVGGLPFFTNARG